MDGRTDGPTFPFPWPDGRTEDEEEDEEEEGGEWPIRFLPGRFRSRLGKEFSSDNGTD